MSQDQQDARRDCEALARAHGRYADAWDADGFANLFAPDGTFDRLGTLISGREHLRQFLASRPRNVAQTHRNGDYTFTLGLDGTRAVGTLDLELDRELLDSDEPNQTLYCKYMDEYVKTAEGWRIQLRKVVLVDAPT